MVPSPLTGDHDQSSDPQEGQRGCG